VKNMKAIVNIDDLRKKALEDLKKLYGTTEGVFAACYFEA